jgi:single-stranded-DNA-specific exonuclease
MENWIEKEQPSIDDIKRLNETLKIPEYICSLLLQRNINSLEKAKQFFRPNLNLLHDPFLMKDMLKVVKEYNFLNLKIL